MKSFNNNLTILSNTCIAGKVYHELNLRFCSPTINTFIPQKDFVKFCLNRDYYLKEELTFLKNNSNKDAMLGDIRVGFGHYETCEIAKNKWNERKLRITDNLFIIASDGNGVSREELNQLSEIGAKRVLVLLSRKDKSVVNGFCLYSMLGLESAATHMLILDKKKRQTFFSEINFKRWIKGKKRFRKIKSYYFLMVYLARMVIKKLLFSRKQTSKQ